MFFSVKISRQGTSSSFGEQKQEQKWCQGSVSVRWLLWCDPFQPIWDKKKKHLGKKKQITALHRAWRKTSSDVQTFLFSSTFQSAINDLRSGLHFTGGRIALIPWWLDCLTSSKWITERMETELVISPSYFRVKDQRTCNCPDAITVPRSHSPSWFQLSLSETPHFLQLNTKRLPSWVGERGTKPRTGYSITALEYLFYIYQWALLSQSAKCSFVHLFAQIISVSACQI